MVGCIKNDMKNPGSCPGFFILCVCWHVFPVKRKLLALESDKSPYQDTGHNGKQNQNDSAAYQGAKQGVKTIHSIQGGIIGKVNKNA